MVDYCFDYIEECEAKKKHIYWSKTPCEKIDELSVTIIDDGICLPRIKNEITGSLPWMGYGGVINSDGEWVKESGVYRCHGEIVYGGKYDYSEGNLIASAETVIYMGPFFPHWGHFLLDFIPRLWYVLEHESDKKIIFCGWNFAQGEIEGNYKRLLELIGVDVGRLIDVRKPTRFRKIIIPKPSFERGSYYSGYYRKLIEKIVNSINYRDEGLCDKLVFSRAQFGIQHKKEYGIDQIDKLFEKNGFRIIYPEEHTLDEQIYFLRNCKQFVVTPGGASMNLLFANANIEIVFLQKSNEIVNINDLYQIAELINASKVTYVDAYFKLYKTQQIDYGGGLFFLGITNNVIRFARDTGMNVCDVAEGQSVKDWLQMVIKYGKMEIYKKISLLKRKQ